MTDLGQPKLNEFYLLHTHPTKVFRRVKDVEIEVIQVGSGDAKDQGGGASFDGFTLMTDDKA